MIDNLNYLTIQQAGGNDGSKNIYIYLLGMSEGLYVSESMTHRIFKIFENFSKYKKCLKLKGFCNGSTALLILSNFA